METFLTTIHVITCFFLIFVVLIQSGRGGGLGGAFGGGGQQVFGGTGAAPLLTKLTTAAAAIFMITSLGLSIVSSDQGSVLTLESVEPAAELFSGSNEDSAEVDEEIPANIEIEQAAENTEAPAPAEESGEAAVPNTNDVEPTKE